ncbi:hypothetical protein J4732_08625 [Serratia marcescens]|uniref:Uncharacterized protein n=1 Tax=Serratia marcescens TaxID=615 RepID=A0A939NKT6_SERMA|nr:hypothetical protein [Serratia marcescens]
MLPVQRITFESAARLRNSSWRRPADGDADGDFAPDQALEQQLGFALFEPCAADAADARQNAVCRGARRC